MKIGAHTKIMLLAILLVLLSTVRANATCGDGSFSEFKLTADTPVDVSAVDAQFGRAVAVSGNNMVVAFTAEHAVYVFNYDEDLDDWIPKQKLQFSSPPPLNGNSVAIDGDTVVVGDIAANSAYVFRYDEDQDSWTEEQILSGTPFTYFGISVAVSGDTVVVGAPFEGLAYVFKRQMSDDDTSAEWSPEELQTTTPTSPPNGWAVAISGDTLVVGDPFEKSAQVFTRSDSNWTPEKNGTLTADEAVGEYFGGSVAIDGDTVVVGAPPYLNAFWAIEPLPGSAHVFRRELVDGTWQWNEGENLPLSQPQPPNGFGLSVAISGDRLVVGAPNDTDDAGFVTGMVYLFKYDGNNWVEDPVQPKLIPTTEPGLEEGDQFGWSVSMDVSSIAVGSPSNVALNGYLKAGAAYVFTPNEAPVSEVHSTLGRIHHGFFPAWEIFEFTGAQGDEATLTLEADPNGNNNHGKGVSVFVKDKIRGERFFMKERWALGTPMQMELPADGEYRVFVVGHPWFFRGEGFRGDYTLKLEGICAELRKVSGRKRCK